MRRRRAGTGAAFLLVLVLVAAACATPATPAAVAPTPPPRERPQGPQEDAAPAEGDAAIAGALAAPAADRAPPAAGAAREPVRRELILIEPGGGEVRPEPGELARRSAAARERSAAGGTPRITNDNLAEVGRGGQVTVAGGGAMGEPEAEGDAEEAAAGAAGAPAEVRDEAFWRRSAREIREEWRRTLDEIEALEESAADLRWRFYAEDDPWLRDGRIKPEWDRTLDRLSEARRDLVEIPRRLEELIEEGRRAGALPGWLREGIELEPRPDEAPAVERDPAEPIEPPTLDEGGDDEPGGSA